jgi:acyl carrier protein
MMDHAPEPITARDAVLARLQDIFRAELDDDALEIGIDTRQLDLKAWDSLAHIRLVSGIESEFDFQFNLAEIEEINSVRQFVDLILEHAP